MKSRLLIAIFAAVFINTGTAYGVSFIDLGQTVTGISGDGSVVFNPTSRWTAAGGWETWDSYTGGDVTGEVSVVSYDGSVVAGSSGNTAYHWSASTEIVSIGNFPSNYSYSITDISADGVMVVGTASDTNNYDTHEAFLWTSGSGMVGLGLYTNANGVTSDRSIIAGATGTPPSAIWPPSAAFWTEINDWTIVDLMDPGSYDRATSIADNGTMIVASIFGPRGFHPRLWSPDTGFSDLDPRVVYADEANDISSDGSTVVGREYALCDACFWAWVWDETNGRRYIDAMLIAEGIDLTDWAYLHSAVSVSADGLLIVGNGVSTDGISKGWILNLATTDTDGEMVDNNLVYVAAEPCRIADTRQTAIMAKGVARDFQVSGADLSSQGGDASGCEHPRVGTGVEPLAASVYLVAVTAGGTGSGWLTAFPSDQDDPSPTSIATVNYAKGQVVGNTTNVTLCPGDCPTGGLLGLVSFNSAQHVVMDIQGYFYPAAGSCSADMVAAGSVCVDKYEASVWSAATGGTQYGAITDDYPCLDDGSDCGAAIYARSEVNKTPSTRITQYQASIACANVDKRLPTTTEWQMAASGTQSGLASGCNFSGTATATSSNTGCDSTAGAFDMIGNVWEWTAELEPTGVGFTDTDNAIARVLGDGYDNQGDASIMALWNTSPQSSDARIGFRCVR